MSTADDNDRILRGMLDDLVNLEEGLSDWEVEFVDDLAKQAEKPSFRFSYRQETKIREIHEEKCQ